MFSTGRDHGESSASQRQRFTGVSDLPGIAAFEKIVEFAAVVPIPFDRMIFAVVDHTEPLYRGESETYAFYVVHEKQYIKDTETMCKKVLWTIKRGL